MPPPSAPVALPTDDSEIIAIPVAPITTARHRRALGTVRVNRAVTIVVTTGNPPLIIPVIDELTVRSATG